MTGAMKLTALASGAMMVACGCYATTEVQPTQIASIQQPLAAPKKMAGSTRLGPNSEIRARFYDGSVTPWLPASGLSVAKDGLVSGRSFPLTAATEARISGAGGNAADMLSATAPPEARIDIVDDQLRLRIGDPRLLLPWIATYATGAAELHQPAGMVSFQGPHRHWASDWIPVARFATVAPSGFAKLRVAEGIPWRDVEALEVHNLEPIRTTGAIIGAPIAMTVMVAAMAGAVAAAADGKDPTPSIELGAAVGSLTAEAAASADADAETGGAPVRPIQNRPSVLVTADGTATPLFSGAARRRDKIKLVLAGEAGMTSDGAWTGAAGAGIRISDFVELTARVRALPFNDMQTAGSPAPVGFLYGGRLVLHIDGDGDPRTEFVFGGELLDGSTSDGTSLLQGSLIAGPRFGITNKTFVSLLVAPSFLAPSGSPWGHNQTVGQFLFSAEFGFDL